MISEQDFLRFIEKFEIDEVTLCWNWTGGFSDTGYGGFRAGGKAHNAHKVSYECFIGDVPDGLCVLHDCPHGDNRKCVNPSHLWSGTRGDNNRDAASKGRTPRGNVHWNCKIPEGGIEKIFAMKSSGSLQKEIAAVFGVHQSHISDILNGYRRKAKLHVEQSATDSTPC